MHSEDAYSSKRETEREILVHKRHNRTLPSLIGLNNYTQRIRDGIELKAIHYLHYTSPIKLSLTHRCWITCSDMSVRSQISHIPSFVLSFLTSNSTFSIHYRPTIFQCRPILCLIPLATKFMQELARGSYGHIHARYTHIPYTVNYFRKKMLLADYSRSVDITYFT